MGIGIIFLSLYITIIYSGCPNMCNSHGTCENDGTCSCITHKGLGVNQGRTSLESYTGPDCSQRTCPTGLTFTISSVKDLLPDRVKDEIVSIQQRLLEAGLPDYLDTENLKIVEVNNTVVFGKYGGSMTCERTVVIDSEFETSLRFLNEMNKERRADDDEQSTTIPISNSVNTTSISNINVLAQSGKYLLILWNEEMKRLYGNRLLVDLKEEGDSNTGTDNEKEESPSSDVLQCTVLSQRTDLSLLIITTFEDDIYYKDDILTESDRDYSGYTLYNSTIPFYNRLLSYNNFTNNTIYNFACVSNLETNKVQIYNSLIASELYNTNNKNTGGDDDDDDEVMFLLNTTNLPEGPCYFLGNGENNIKIEQSEVYKKYMRKQGNDIYFTPKSSINSVNGYKDGVTVSKGNEGLELIRNELLANNKTVGNITVDNIDYDDKEFLNTASYIDIDSFFGSNKNEVIVHLKVGSILHFIVTENKITTVKQYVITKIIFINYNGDICDITGKVIKPSVDNNKMRILQSITTTSSINNNNNGLIMIITTEPLFDNLKDAKVIYTLKSAENAHLYLECSGSGLCNRNTGKCECFVGYEGDACQRISCPFNCNNHGRCVSVSEAIKGEEKNKEILEKFGFNGGAGESENKFYACLCDSGYRGADCSLRECPSFTDPEKATNQRKGDGEVAPKEGVEHRDCSGRGICDYSTGNCKCFDGFVGTGCENIASVY